MIQRKQTIWLLLAAIAGFLTTQVPLYAGRLAGEVVKKFTATESLILFAVSILTALVAVLSIFLFKNRKSQIKWTFLGLLLSLALIALEVWQIGVFEKNNSFLRGSYDWGALLPIAMALFFILAIGGIRRDDKLVRSLDRLR